MKSHIGCVLQDTVERPMIAFIANFAPRAWRLCFGAATVVVAVRNRGA